jgi:hypothetical protein
VIWTPYTDNLIESASLLCIEGSDLWLTVVLLHYFVIIEMYCPDQVMHQFRLHQHIADDVDTFDNMHVVNR